MVTTCRVRLEKPALKNNTADVERLSEGISRALDGAPVTTPRELWNGLPSLLRRADFRVSCSLWWDGARWSLLDVTEESFEHRPFALGVDVGTTTVVCFLVDLDRGEVVAEKSIVNPQVVAGPDILSRIQYADRESGGDALRKAVTDGINEAVDSLCGDQGIAPRNIMTAAAAGNTTMTHFFLGLDTSNIRKEPYIPVVNTPGWIPAAYLGLKLHPRACVFVFPNVGSYFGGDLISGILTSGMHRDPEVSLLVDVGTNAEVVLGNSEWLLACAGAAGPALEGGVAKMGMTAGHCAIDHLTVDPETLEASVSVIGSESPAGICGSGLIDLVAELFAAGVLDQRGKIRPLNHPRILDTDVGRAYMVVPGDRTSHGRDILLTQVDLDILLRSKAAMFAILTTILEEVGLGFGDVRRFYVAGTFGTYIDPAMAIRIGMIPDLPLERYVPLGNSSGRGTVLLLRNRDLLEEVERIRNNVTYLELNVNQRFMGLFSAAKFLPHTDPDLFPSVMKGVGGKGNL